MIFSPSGYQWVPDSAFAARPLPREEYSSYSWASSPSNPWTASAYVPSAYSFPAAALATYDAPMYAYGYQTYPSCPSYATFPQPVLAPADPAAARTFVEQLTSVWAGTPDHAEHLQMWKYANEGETGKIVVDVLKARLQQGGYAAARAINFLNYLPFDALADVHKELDQLADWGSGLAFNDDQLVRCADGFRALAADSKAQRDLKTNERNWELWTAMHGRSRATWPALPNDDAYAYPKWPDASVPDKEPDGWRWMLMPAHVVSGMERGLY